MANLKKKFEQTYESVYFPFVILLIIELVLHIFLMKFNYGDDLYVLEHLNDMSVWEKIKLNYLTWTSGVLQLFVEDILARLPVIVWQVLDSCMVTLLAYSISAIVVETDRRFNNWLVVCLVLIYPFMDMATAGWLVTTRGYLWGSALSIYACTLLKENAKEHWWRYITCGAAALYGCGGYQKLAIFCVLFLTIIVYTGISKNNRLRYKTLFLMFFVVVNLCIHLACPGNQNRFDVSVIDSYPDFRLLTIVEKLQLGFSELMSNFQLAPNLTFLILTSVIAFTVCKKYKSAWCKLIAITPLSLSIAVGFCSSISLNIFPGLRTLSPETTISATKYGGLVTMDNFSQLKAYIPLAVLLFCMVLCAAGIFISIENKQWSGIAVLIYLCGIGSGMVMGFSPTIYVSNTRPLIYTYFCFIIVAVVIFTQNIELFSERQMKYCLTGLSLAAGFNLLSIAIQAAGLIRL